MSVFGTMKNIIVSYEFVLNKRCKGINPTCTREKETNDPHIIKGREVQRKGVHPSKFYNLKERVYSLIEGSGNPERKKGPKSIVRKGRQEGA